MCPERTDSAATAARSSSVRVPPAAVGSSPGRTSASRATTSSGSSHLPIVRCSAGRTVVVMILVTGATGTIGSEVVRQLVARGEKVRALTRDPERAELPPGVEVVRGHHRDVGSVAAAMAGADRAFLVGVFGPEDRDSDRGMVEAARAAGVRRIVKLSAIMAGDPRTGLGGIAHGHGEEAVRESGLEWVI